MSEIRPEEISRDMFWFALSVPASGSGELALTVPRDGTVERLGFDIPVGSAWSLQLRPVVRRHEGHDEPIPKYPIGGIDYITGDGSQFSTNVSKPVQGKEELVVKYINTDAVNEHRFIVFMEVDYAGGKMRAGVING